MPENKMTRAGAGAGRVSCFAADTRNVACAGAQRHHDGSLDVLRLAYLRRYHGVTEAQANALASLIWGGWA
jgi:hypothetical protein